MERRFIRWLRGRIPPDPQIAVGLGDDAAVVKIGDDSAVVTCDLVTDQVDFELDRCDPRRVGRKGLAVNLSDMAAMAARPIAAFIALALPRSGAAQLAEALYEGIVPLAKEFHVAIAGGDTNTWPGRLVISVTLLGQLDGRPPLLRSSARCGDQILVTGSFGGSILGKHFDFQPRVREALYLREHFELHAGIDVSDGLSADLAHLAEESGCGALVELERIPIADAARQLAAASGGETAPLDRALADGEDFELILAVPPAAAETILAQQPLDVPVSRIGSFIDEPGLWRKQPDGTRRRLEIRGYEH